MVVADVGDLGGDQIECPFCAERIQRKALKCKHCGEFLNKGAPAALAEASKPSQLSTPAPEKKAAKPKRRGGAGPLMLLLAIIGVMSLVGIAMTEPGSDERTGVAAVGFLVLCPVAWWIGNAIRKFAMPSSVFVTGGFAQLIWQKVFWLIGPQLVAVTLVAWCFLSLVTHHPDGKSAESGNSIDVGNVVAAVGQNATVEATAGSPSQEPSSQDTTEASAPAASDESVQAGQQVSASESNQTAANCDGGTKAAQLVCADADLGRLDQLLAEAVQKRWDVLGAHDRAVLGQDQRDWLADYRDHCTTKDCLVQVYQQRLAQF